MIITLIKEKNHITILDNQGNILGQKYLSEDMVNFIAGIFMMAYDTGGSGYFIQQKDER